ncbi:diacylglycerol kinase [Pseudomonas neustonica]|uniref:Diacylglycerol kinase n=1 Tax=Pseudomonas neustonica TaxID=2487346 RepID=A0ABX9XMD5_9PSED|nr:MULTISPECIES: diacylglycerol kinase [Pseudomonas]MAB24138.1 diacylglycerol kinase [Pseudomonadales bacterium]ROZ84537.1 diacylglycerol kinase [Pseudomonas sp. SSM44]ROZ86340.1 diacylglycerol kinase [Pseudomonas neustonica]|tara:strand:+ start:179 stop:571 length:393 start_codon:yes stop_codon:yes gene_type:complete
MRPNPAPREEALAFKSRGGFGRVFKATGYSLAGLRAAIVGEAAFRQLLALSAVLIPLACLLEVSSLERAVLLLVVFVALIVELLNSAIEAVVDRISLELHPLSKQAKDMGSAAQLISLLMILTVWLVILL